VTVSRTLSRVLLGIALLLFLALAWTGVSGAFHQFSHTNNTLGQQVLGALSGVASLLIAWGIVWLLRFSTRSGA